MRLESQQLVCGYGRRTVVSEASLVLESGQVVCLLGPNGSGKTTLFKTLLSLLRPLGGRVLIDGEDAAGWSRARLARAVAYVPQSHAPTFPFKVLDMALMGRAARLGIFASPSRRDEAIAMEALEQVGIAHLAERPVGEISGGERQLTLIARALTQQASLMILDEPTSNLDFGNQVRVLEHIRNLAARGIGLLMTTHFPDHALLCSSSVAIMHQGRLWTTGAAHEAITEQTLHDIYGVRARVVRVTDVNGLSVHTCIPTIAPFVQEIVSEVIPSKASLS